MMVYSEKDAEELPENWKEGRSKRRFMDVVRDDSG